jgi:pimeloyl-ACP methyl ester carboxylesterase
MPVLSVNGIDLHYERQGAGPPLLLLAGMASDGASWTPLRDGLAARFALIVPDNRCAGRTRPIPCTTGRREMGEDIVALLDRLGLDRVHVIGHSMGAMLALDLAAGHPGRVASVVAMSTAGRAGPQALSLFADLALLYGASGVPAEAWFRLLFHFLFTPAFFADREAVLAASRAAAAYAAVQPPEAFRAQVAALGDFADPVDPARIACPLLAVSGAWDVLCPPEAVRERFAGHEIAIIPDAAHSVHWERPAAVLAAILAFHDRLRG